MSSTDPKGAHQPDQDVTLFLGPRGLYFNHLGFFHGYRKSRLQLVTLSCYSSSDPYYFANIPER